MPAVTNESSTDSAVFLAPGLTPWLAQSGFATNSTLFLVQNVLKATYGHSEKLGSIHICFYLLTSYLLYCYSMEARIHAVFLLDPQKVNK